MRSWLYRNRLRLRAIYGPRPAPPPADPSSRATRKVRVRTTIERSGGILTLRTRA